VSLFSSKRQYNIKNLNDLFKKKKREEKKRKSEKERARERVKDVLIDKYLSNHC